MADEFGQSQSFGESAELGRGEMTLEELDGPFDIRQPRRRAGGVGRERQFQRLNYDLQARQPYQSLADVVLGANQDVKFHRTLTDRTLATKYAKDHRLRLGEDKDYNEDGINDVILFNKFGDPVVINGYALANTEYPYRKAFYETNPKKSDRMRVGGYNKWLKDSFIPANGESIAAWGQKGIKAKRVKEGHSSRVDINQIIKDVISTTFVKLMDPNLAKFILSLLPWFQIYSYINDALIVRYLIDTKAPDLAHQAVSLEDFKRLLKGKNVKPLVDGFLKSDECKAFIIKMLDENGVKSLANMITGGMDKFIGVIRSVSNSPADYITNPELHVQKQLWKEQLAANVDAMRERTREVLNGVIAAK